MSAADLPGPAHTPTKTDEVWRKLMELGSRSSSRFVFMREAAEVLLRHTGASCLDVWAQDHGTVYRWHAAAGPPAVCTLTNIARLGPPLDPQLPLLQQVLGWLGETDLDRRAPGSARGSLWLGDTQPPHGAPPRKRALLPFTVDGGNQGVLQLVAGPPRWFGGENIEALDELARALGAAIVNRRAQFALGERVKELTCMYRIAQLTNEGEPLAASLQRVAELLPPAWQYPEIAKARITLDGAAFASQDFETGPHRLATPLRINGVERGTVEVFYGERCRDHQEIRFHDHEPFLGEERFLIEGVARELCSLIERAEAEAERGVLQEQLRRQDRLATIGQLTAGVAHELNEPLGNILGFAQLTLKTELTAQARHDIERIEQASLYAREIIRKLMLFSRKTPARRGPVDLNRVIEDSVSLLAARVRKAGIRIVRELDPTLPRIEADAAQLQQVAVNLTINAIQAMPDGGTLFLRTRAAGSAVTLSCEDDGCGISPEVRDKIFMPFFTTKEVGQGTGLGLSVVHGIVVAHGGRITVDSAEGRGSRFEIWLPLELAAETSSSAPARDQPEETGP